MSGGLCPGAGGLSRGFLSCHRFVIASSSSPELEPPSNWFRFLEILELQIPSQILIQNRPDLSLLFYVLPA